MRAAAILASILTVAVAAPAGPWIQVAHAGPEEEAARQLQFARDELERRDYERAVRSAESAFRLNPILYDALVVKALAYHGLGNSELALTLLGAYHELAPNGRAKEEANEAEALIRAAIKAEQEEEARRGPGAVRKVEAKTRPEVDPQPYIQRVEKALTAGQCLTARSAAVELVQAAPKNAEGWRLVGDAARCDGEAREAALAYRRYADLGGDDATIISTLKGLRRSLGELEVAIALPDPDAAVSVRVRFGDETVDPEPWSGGPRRFVDLPTRRDLTLEVRGRGLSAVDLVLKPLVPEEKRVVEAAPEWIGLGSIALTRETCPCEVVFFSDIDAAPGKLGKSTEMTAGQITAEVRNQHGVSEVPIELAADATVEFDPLPWATSTLTIVGLPAGASATLTLDTLAGDPVVRQLDLPADVGDIDPTGGIRIAPPQALDSLLGGTGELVVRHPFLGDGTQQIVLEPGTINAATFPWEDLPAVGAIAESFAEWSERAQAKKRAAVAAPIPSTVVALSGLGVGIGFLVASLQGQQQADSLRETYEAGLGSGSQNGLQAAWQAWDEQVRTNETRWSGVAIGGGIAGLGGVITLVIGAQPKRGVSVEEFRPEEALSVSE